jgi:TolB-like protein/Tfp pilus assembly protein PilF
MSEDSATGGLAPEQIRAALGRVAASAAFTASPRMQDFLRYVVEETLAGRGDEIKGYSLALEVFRRGDSFDPANDSVVRVEAARLRRTLTAYYEGEGRDDPIIIGIPKGGYVPDFQVRSNGASAPQPEPSVPEATAPMAVPDAKLPDRPAAGTPAPQMKALVVLGFVALATVLAGGVYWLGIGKDTTLPPLNTKDELSRPARPTIAVLPFEATFGTERDALLGRGLAADISGALTGFHELIVLYAEGGDQPNPESVGPLDVSRYRLQGRVASQRGDVRVLVQLLDARNNRSLWAQNYERQLNTDSLFELQDEITQQVAATIADPYGVIWQSEIARPNRPQSVSAYYCALRAYDYWRELSPEMHAKVRTCLEDAVKVEPDYAVAWSALSYFYMDEYRYGYNPRDDSPPLERALASANKAVALDPFDARAYQALYTVQFLRGDTKEFQRIGKKALELNRNSLDLVGDYGAKLAMSGLWTEGIPLVRNAVERNPAPPGWLFTPLVYYEYMNGNYSAALTFIDRMNTPDYYRTHVLRAMIYGQLGDTAMAKAAIDQIERLKPQFLSDPVDDMRHWGLAAEILAQSVDGLRKAGVMIPATQG